MADYALNQLVPWVRRLARDIIARAREEFISSGTGVFTLSANGAITLVSVASDGELIDLEDVSLQVNTLVVDPTEVPDQAGVVVIYDNSTYDDAAISAFLADAARVVGADLGIKWAVQQVEGEWTITNIPDEEFDLVGGQPILNELIVKLIAIRAGIGAYQDKANQRADQAIMVRDGTTTIDTSKAASAGTRALERMEENYKEALSQALVRRFGGGHQAMGV